MYTYTGNVVVKALALHINRKKAVAENTPICVSGILNFYLILLSPFTSRHAYIRLM